MGFGNMSSSGRGHLQGGGALVIVLSVMSVASLFVPSTGVAGGCGNEAMRAALHSAQLPDCRAYELVTPPAKNGWPIAVTSLNASHVLVDSLGGFVGSDQINPFNYYNIVRENNSWSTSPFTEPVGFINRLAENFSAVSHDMAKGIFTYEPSAALVYEPSAA